MNTQALGIWACLAFAGGTLLTTGDNEALAQEGAMGIEEITVTARRREENLMETPVSITAFTASDLEARLIDSVDQIAEATPGLFFNRRAGNNNHTSRIFIRGIGQADQVPTKQVGVGLYVDGVYVAQNAGSLIDVVDVASVEVLRGPQGTLFGRNTVGGAIQITTIKPSEEFDAAVEVLAGSRSRLRLKGHVNVPFADNFFGRFSAVTQDEDGYIDTPNATSEGKGGNNIDAFRGALRWLPSEAVTVDLTLDASRQNSFGVPTVLGTPTITASPGPSGMGNTAAQYNGLGPFPGASGFLGQPQFDGSFYLGPEATTSLTANENENETDVFGTNLTVQWDISDNVSIKSITSYRDIDVVAFGDFDNSPLRVFQGFDNHEGDALSQEFQLSGVTGRVNWVAGLYYYSEDLINFNQVEFPLFSVLSGATVDNESQAVFGQFTYEVTDRFDVTVGARYTDEDLNSISNEDTQFVNATLCPTGNPALGPVCAAAGLGPPVGPPGYADVPPNLVRLVPAGETFNASEQEFEPYLNLSYNFTDGLMAYISYSEGFKGGGFTQRILPGQTIQSFQPEFAETVEIGTKWQSDRVRLAAAIFDNDYKDLQVLTLEQAAGVTRNAANAEIRGGEFELTAVPTDRLTLSLGLAYIDTEYSNLDPGVPFSIDAQFPFTAEWQRNASATYTFPLASGELTARLDYFYIDEYFAEAENLPEQRYGDYTVWNGGLTYTPDSDKWEVALAVRNLADEHYRIGGSQTVFGNGFTQETVAPPRTLSVRYKYRF